MDLVERFINYTKFDTQSSEDSESVPSTAKQLEFAKYLKHELEEEGLSDVEMDDMGYIYATLKGNTKKRLLPSASSLTWTPVLMPAEKTSRPASSRITTARISNSVRASSPA